MASPKQEAVLDLMRSGKSFDNAYTEVGLSDYGHNRAEFLWRLLSSKLITVSVNDTKE